MDHKKTIFRKEMVNMVCNRNRLFAVW